MSADVNSNYGTSLKLGLPVRSNMVLVKIASIVFSAFKMPDWKIIFVVSLLILRFPAALIHAWAFDVTPERIKMVKRGTRREN